MICIKFPCGDLEPVTIIKYEGEQVCVKMEFGPFWTHKNKLVMLPW